MAKSTVLFIDECCPKPYEGTPREGNGGTEITVAMVAGGLAASGLFEVIVAQHNRDIDEYDQGVRYTYLAENDGLEADYVVCLRLPETLLKAREKFPHAKLYLWAHDLYTQDLAVKTLAALEATQPKYILAVSDFHRQQIKGSMFGLPSESSTKIRLAYNPISDDLKPDGTEYNPNRLCFISSPHKGLKNALSLFGHLREWNPDLELHITNPGYYEGPKTLPEGVVAKENSPYSDVIALLRSSLCLFFPNTTFPETFGRVYAEAEAVGTPCLTHNLGAAAEVLSHPSELVDCRDPKAVLETIKLWHRGCRPTVRMKPQFRLTRVIQNWIREVLV